MEQPYAYITDPYPQQAPEHNRLYPFFQFLREGRLTTSKCRLCGAIPWPPRVVCPECMSDDLEWYDLPQEGNIYVYTVQEAGLPAGYDPPIVFALIDLPNGLRLLSVIEDSDISRIRNGSDVELIVKKVSHDRVMPAFRLKQ